MMRFIQTIKDGFETDLQAGQRMEFNGALQFYTSEVRVRVTVRFRFRVRVRVRGEEKLTPMLFLRSSKKPRNLWPWRRKIRLLPNYRPRCALALGTGKLILIQSCIRI